MAAAIDALLAKMAPIEGELVQVKLGSTEGMLRFPAMLNEQLDTFRSVLESDRAPTRAQVDLDADYAKRVDAQVAAWKRVATTDVPALNQKIASSHTAIIDPEH